MIITGSEPRINLDYEENNPLHPNVARIKARKNKTINQILCDFYNKTPKNLSGDEIGYKTLITELYFEYLEENKELYPFIRQAMGFESEIMERAYFYHFHVIVFIKNLLQLKMKIFATLKTYIYSSPSSTEGMRKNLVSHAFILQGGENVKEPLGKLIPNIDVIPYYKINETSFKEEFGIEIIFKISEKRFVL